MIISSSEALSNNESSSLTTDTQALWQPCYIYVPGSGSNAMPVELVSTIRSVIIKAHSGNNFLRFTGANAIVAHVNGTFVNGDSDVTDSGASQVVTKNATCNVSSSAVGTITVTATDAAGGYSVTSSVDLYDSAGLIVVPSNTAIPSAAWLAKVGQTVTISVNATAAGEVSTYPIATAGTIALGLVSTARDYNVRYNADAGFVEIKVPRGVAATATSPVYMWIQNKWANLSTITLIRS